MKMRERDVQSDGDWTDGNFDFGSWRVAWRWVCGFHAGFLMSIACSPRVDMLSTPMT